MGVHQQVSGTGNCCREYELRGNLVRKNFAQCVLGYIIGLLNRILIGKTIFHWFVLGVLVVLILWPEKVKIQNAGVNRPEMQKVESKYILFHTNAYLPKKDNSIVKFPYKFESEHQELWLSVQVKPGTQPVIILVDHPIFNKLNWRKIVTESLVLYQEIPKYTSIDEFLEKVPSQEIVIADPHLIYELGIIQGPNVRPLSDWDENLDFKYFLTTYHEPEIRPNYLWFESKIDLTNAMESPCPTEMGCKEQITWKLDMPDGGAGNPLHIGMIHVDQRQW